MEPLVFKVIRNPETGNGETKHYEKVINRLKESDWFRYVGDSRIDGSKMYAFQTNLYERLCKTNKILNETHNINDYLKSFLTEINDDLILIGNINAPMWKDVIEKFRSIEIT